MTRWYRHVYLDYRRYRAVGAKWYEVPLTQGFWASCVYRVGRAAVFSMPPGILRKLVRFFFTLVQKVIEITCGIALPPECEVGEGLYIGHFGTMFFPSHGRLGRNCNVGQGVTLGVGGVGAERGAPTIGDRVFIGAHSIVVGKITVGADAMICAGSVVCRSIPPRGVVMGNPARVISYDGSFDHVVYDGMNQDPARQAALANDPTKPVAPPPVPAAPVPVPAAAAPATAPKCPDAPVGNVVPVAAAVATA